MQPSDAVSERDLFQKIGRVPQEAGCAVIRVAVTLFVLMTESTVPLWVKVSIAAALGYFVSPIDAIPDFLPGGYVDDLAVMTLLLGQLDVFLDAEVLKKVERLLPRYCRKKLLLSAS